jgi:hypothetical protein
MFHLYREAVLAREREEDERWRQRMLDKFAEDDRIGTVHSVHTHYICSTHPEQTPEFQSQNLAG